VHSHVPACGFITTACASFDLHHKLLILLSIVKAAHPATDSKVCSFQRKLPLCGPDACLVADAAVTGAICIVQILAMGFFAGDQRGLNLVVGAVSFNAYSYKGLVRNELQGGRTWGCPQQNYMPGTYTQVSMVCNEAC